MKKHRWIVWLTVGGLVLTACAPPIASPMSDGQPPPLSETLPTCDSETMAGSATERVRAWVLFNVEDPEKAASGLTDLLTEGGDEWVIVRADVVAGGYNLVVPVDAANTTSFMEAQKELAAQLGDPASVLCVLGHVPAKTTEANSFVTPAEQEGFKNDFPNPGRQVPNSPGANPWG